MCRVLAVVPDLRNPGYKGGIQVFNNFLTDAIRALGHDLRAIAVNDRAPDTVGEKWIRPCASVHPARKLVAAARLVQEIATFKPDLVLCGHLNFAPVVSRVCARMGDVPFVTVLHGVELWDPNMKAVNAAAKGAEVLCVSRYTRRLAIELMPSIDPERIVVFFDTFDHDRFVPKEVDAALRDRLGLAPAHKVALTVCRLAPSERLKGYDQVVRALPAVRETVPDVRYLLAGRGDDAERIRQLSEELGVRDLLIMPGFIPEEEIVDVFNLCDVFVMPSKKEGFGIVYLEAMSCGKPVIAGNVDGSTDPLMDGEAGILVDPDNVEQIARAITDVVTDSVDPSLIDPVLLRERAIERFGQAAFEKQTSEMIERVMRMRSTAEAM